MSERGDGVDGRRRPVRQHVGQPGGGHRRHDRPDALGARPQDLDARHAGPWVLVPTLVSDDPALQVFDKANGGLIAKIALPENATGALMTYFAGGKQYVVVPIGGCQPPGRAGRTEPSLTAPLARPHR